MISRNWWKFVNEIFEIIISIIVFNVYVEMNDFSVKSDVRFFINIFKLVDSDKNAKKLIKKNIFIIFYFLFC